MSDNKKKGSRKLSEAFEEGDENQILQLIKQFPIKQRSLVKCVWKVYKQRRDQGMTPLIAAILHGNCALCERLIDEGGNIGQRVQKIKKCAVHFGNTKCDICYKLPILGELAKEQIQGGPFQNIFFEFDLTTPMFWAVKCDLVSVVEKLITNGVNKDLPVEKINGTTALMLAISGNKIDIVELLLKHGADLHASDAHSLTPLELAVQQRMPHMIGMLLEHGDDLNCKRHQESPLLRAIQTGDIALVDTLIELGADINQGWVNGKFSTPLCVSIADGFLDIAWFLISKGADVNAKFHKDLTAFHFLANISDKQSIDYSQKIELAKLLLENGAEINVKDNKDETPLHIAICKFDVDVIKFLLSAGADVNVTTRAQGPILNYVLSTCIFYLNVEKGVMVINQEDQSVNMVTKDGLQVKIENSSYKNYQQNYYEVVRLLISAGANVNASDEKKRTPIHFACKTEKFELVKLLVGSGAVINVQDSNGVSPLHISVVVKSLSIVDYLIGEGANVNTKDVNNISPLSLAISNRMLNIVRALVKAGPDLQEILDNGRTYLHFAVDIADYKLAKLLIEVGADVNVEDEKGFNPFEVGIIQPRFTPTLVEMFLQYGLNGNHRDELVISPYHLVFASHNPKFLKLFWYFGYPYDVYVEDEFLLKSLEAGFVFNRVQSSMSNHSTTTPGSGLNELFCAQNEFITGIKENNENIVLNAIKKGAEARGCSKEIPFPLHYAVKRGYHKIAGILLSKGVPVNTVDTDGVTALEVAAEQEDVELLLQYGACYTRGLGGPLYQTIRTAFRHVRRGQARGVEMVESSAGAQDWRRYHVLVNCVDGRGLTLMASAVQAGHAHLADRLMRLRLNAPSLASLY